MNSNLLPQCFWTWNQFELALQPQLIIYPLWCNCGQCMHQSLAFQYNIHPWPKLLGQLACRETPDTVHHSCIVSWAARAPPHIIGVAAPNNFSRFLPSPHHHHLTIPTPAARAPVCKTSMQERAEVCGVDHGPGPRLLLRSQPWLIIETQGLASPLL